MLPSLQIPLKFCLIWARFYPSAPYAPFFFKSLARSWFLPLCDCSWNYSKSFDGVKFCIFRSQLLLSGSNALRWMHASWCGEKGLS